MSNFYLGIHDGHNAAVSLFVDHKLISAYHEERYSKEKNFDGFPKLALSHLLSDHKISMRDISRVGFGGNYQPSPLTRQDRLDVFSRRENHQGFSLRSLAKNLGIGLGLRTAKNQERRIQKFLSEFEYSEKTIDFFDHHLCHSVTASVEAGKQDGPMLILTNDGAGDSQCASVRIYEKNEFKLLSTTNEYHSIGILYAIFTYLFNMVPLEHEYKIMGMAPYADQERARAVADRLHDLFHFQNDGLTWKFGRNVSVFDSISYFRSWQRLYRFDVLMAGLQLFTEEFLATWILNATGKTGISNIGLSGGTFMNVKANQKIRELEGIKSIFVFPSCGDETNAIAAGYLAYRSDLHDDEIEPLEFGNMYLGGEFKDININEFKKSNVFQVIESDVLKRSADLIADGKVVGWIYGKSEFGARALGHRSILANPGSREVVKTINEAIKCRDFWMPFACSILDVDAEKYIQIDSKNKPRFMIMTYASRNTHDIVAGTHAYDASVRPQIVSKSDCPMYYELIETVGDRTGVNAVLNTSLNLHGLPIVEDMADVLHLMENSKIDAVAINNKVLILRNEKVI